jgi:hypothetical protein
MYAECHHAEILYTECHMQSVIMLSVIMLSTFMMSVIMLKSSYIYHNTEAVFLVVSDPSINEL